MQPINSKRDYKQFFILLLLIGGTLGNVWFIHSTAMAQKPKVVPGQSNSSTNSAGKSSKSNSTGSSDATLPPGTEEYNKGVSLFQIAQIQSEKGNLTGQKQLLKEAIRHFQTSLDQNPKLIESQSNIGFAYLTLREYHRSIASFQKALELNPHHLNTLNGLSTAYALDNKLDRALDTFNQLTILAPDNSQYFFNKGSVLQRAKRIDEARIAYEQALKIQPNDQRALFNLGTLYENEGKLDEARPFYEKAKGVEIGNTIGLEAIKRLELIDNRSKDGYKPDDRKARCLLPEGCTEK